MYMIVISKEDPASVNIEQELFNHSSWVKCEGLKFDGNDVFSFRERAFMVKINSYHLFFDNLDVRVRDELSKQSGSHWVPSAVVFASKHKSASGLRTLTVHPVGNFGEAEYGGRSQELVPAAPQLMTAAYRIMYKRAKENNLDHRVTFEATHHGPYLETPSFFIEIGSDESAWGDKTAARVLAGTIMEFIEGQVEEQSKNYPVAVGVGGGHYAPRHSDVARKKQISFGHIIPSYALEGITDRVLNRAVERTKGATLVYFHRKAIKKEQYRELKEWFEDQGLVAISSEELEALA
ncbi:D-aminoacyl-tRNA deacylase [[Eubacterium] cellulosolvens]